MKIKVAQCTSLAAKALPAIKSFSPHLSWYFTSSGESVG